MFTIAPNRAAQPQFRELKSYLTLNAPRHPAGPSVQTMLRRISPILVLAAVLTACSKKPPVAPPAPTTTTTSREDQPTSTTRSDEETARAERERLERERLEREEAERAERVRVLQQPVYFAYDRSDLTEQARNILESKIEVLKAHSDIRIRIVGHTDERGSDEYNQALGQRRAAAAQRYLVQRGIAAERIEYVSLGEAQPVCRETSESCWGDNRRDEFEILH